MKWEVPRLGPSKSQRFTVFVGRWQEDKLWAREVAKQLGLPLAQALELRVVPQRLVHSGKAH
jgi:hypothetical protein